MKAQDQYSWKTDGYVWMLILIPSSAVVMGIILLTLAIQSDTGLVVDDYYRQGKAINRVLDRDTQATAMGLEATLRLDASRNRLEFRLDSGPGSALDQQLVLHFFHSTRAGRDRTVLLKRVGDRDYIGDFTELSAGRWDVQVSTGQWRLVASLWSPGNTSLVLSSSVK
ncbi:MAG: FixH family protein [Gammaproteobacteria bacterium]